MKKLMFTLLYLLISILIFSQPLTGTKTVKTSGGDYSSIAAAITALNTNGVGTGGVTFNIDAGFTETAVNLAITTTTGSSSNPIVFQKSGSGANPLITAGTGTSTSVDGILKIVGTDYVTIDRIDLRENSSNTTPTTMMEWGYAVLINSGTNGSQHITIKNCTISLNKTNLTSVGIYMANHNSSSTSTIAITSVNGANSYNKFFSNNISNVYGGISLFGYNDASPYTYYDQNNEIGKDGANLITNFGGGANTVTAIYVNNQNNCKIANNIINGGSGSTGPVYGIGANNGNLSNIDFISNKISLTSASTSSTLYGIYNAVGSNGTNNNVNIYNNIIRNLSFTAFTTGVIYGIYTTGTPNKTNLCKNIIDSISTVGSGAIYGLFNNSQASIVFIDSNDISTISRTGMGAIYGLYQNYTGSYGLAKIFDNHIHHLSAVTASSITGLHAYPVNTTKEYIYSNNIYSLNSSGGLVTGLYQQSGDTNFIYKNKIYDLTSTLAAGIVYGINMNSGNCTYFYNNYLSELKTPASTDVLAVSGFYIYGGTKVGLYYNTVYLNASSSGTNFGSTCINGAASSSTTLFDFRNNIFVNKSTPGTSIGTSNVYYFGFAGLTTYTNTSNNNCIYAGNPGPKRMIFTNTSFSDSTLALFKSRVSPRDANSVTENVPFINVSSSPYNLHLQTSVGTQCESGGNPVNSPLTIADDYDGHARNTTTTDIGADEGNFILLDLSAPIISFTPLPNTSATTTRTLTTTITDPSKVPTNGTGMPRLYWKKNNGSYSTVTATSIGNNKFNFTFGSAVAAGDSVSYFIVAQDSASTPNVGAYPLASGFSANPPAASVPPTFPVVYKILTPFSGGNYKIGGSGTTPASGCTYVDLTTAFNALKNKEITGAIKFLLTSKYSAKEEDAFPVIITPVAGTSITNTITIQPDSAVNISISDSSTSSMIKLDGADYIIINGSNNNSSSCNLIIENTSTGSLTAAIWLSSTGPNNGCVYVTIKNCKIITGSSTIVTVGLSVGSIIGTSGDDNDNLTIQNNIFIKAYCGIFCYGNPSGVNNNLIITGNLIGDTNSLNYIGKYGMYIGQTENYTISQNTIKNLIGPTTDPNALLIGAGAVSGTISRNHIFGVKYTGTSGYGGKGIDVMTGSLNSNLTISNNLIYDISGDGWNTMTSDAIIGIRILGGSGGINLYYNTVSLFGNVSRTTSGDKSAAIFIGSPSMNLDFRNNIFSNTINNTASTATAYAIYSDAANTSFSNINYNCYYGGGTQGILGYYLSDITTLAAWKTATLKDTNSVLANPLFVSNMDLHPNSPALNNAAIPITGITIDFDGNSRSTTPDIGAFEFVVKPTAITLSPTSVTANGAILNGTVNANGIAASVSFDYGPTSAYGTTVNATPSTATGTSVTPVSYTLTGLSPNTTWHYRVTATNSFGTAYGADSVFSTPIIKPFASTDSATAITYAEARLNGSINANNSATTISFEYGTTTAYGTTISGTPSALNDTSLTSCYADITGLIPNTLYHFRIKAVNAKGTTTGIDYTFTTSKRKPLAITNAANVFSGTSAKLNGTITAYNATTTVTFEYGQTIGYGSMVTASQSPVNGLTAVSVNYTLIGLSVNTTYHYRVVATNGTDTAYGNDTTFNTSAIVASAITQAATAITGTSATLNGFINANTTLARTTFEYGTTTAYGTSVIGTPDTITGNTNVAALHNLSGLLPNTTYHYRIVARNQVGYSYGNDTFFTTLPILAVMQTKSATLITINSATLGGSAIANNSSTTVTFEYGLTTAYGFNAGATPGTANGMTLTNVTANISGLIANTIYHYRVAGSNLAGNAYGADSIFKTLPMPATVTTTVATSIGATFAQLNGNVNANNTDVPVKFEYGTTIAYGNTITAIPDTIKGNMTTGISAHVIGLTPHTLYHFRAVGNNIAGLVNGNDMTFTTGDTLPILTTQPIISITDKTAASGGNITSDGGAAVTSRGVCWNTNPLPTTVNQRTNNGTGTGIYASALFALKHSTKYYVRAYAVNAIGTAYGDELSFTTTKNSIEEALANGSVRLYSDWSRIFVHVNLATGGEHRIIVYDAIGHELISKKINNATDEIIELPASHPTGIFLVKIITSDNQVFTDRLMIR